MNKMIKIDKSSPVPLYFQVKEFIMNKIEHNEWKLNSAIPSELKLCEEFQISRGTVRQALNDLINEGYLIRKHGLGTYVNRPTYVNPVSSFYFVELNERNKKAKLKRKIFSKKVIEPNEKIKKIMDININKELYEIKALLLIDKNPICLEVSYLLKDLFPNLKIKDLSTMPPYEIFMMKYNIHISEVNESFSLKKIDKETSVKLGLQVGTYALLVNRFACSNNIVFEFRQSIIRTDKCHYKVKLL